MEYENMILDVINWFKSRELWCPPAKIIAQGKLYEPANEENTQFENVRITPIDSEYEQQCMEKFNKWNKYLPAEFGMFTTDRIQEQVVLQKCKESGFDKFANEFWDKYDYFIYAFDDENIIIFGNTDSIPE